MQWAILPEKLVEIQAIVERFESGVKLSDAQIEALIDNSSIRSNPEYNIESPSKQVALVQVTDVLMNRVGTMAQMSGATSYSHIADQVNAAAMNDQVGHIVLRVDSPGGTVNGAAIAADAVANAAKVKPVTAVVSDMAASGAYWMIAQKGVRIVASKTSTLGSIGSMYVYRNIRGVEEKLGVKTVVMTSGKNKAIGHPSVDLSEEHTNKIQERLDNTHAMFVSSVQQGRGLPEDKVSAISESDIFNGEEAVANGLADEIGTLHSVLESITNDMSKQGQVENTKTVQGTENTVELEVQKGTSMEDLMKVVNGLAQTVSTLADQQKAQADDFAKTRAQNLINPLVSSGAITPAKGETLIQNAIENYELVSTMVDGLVPNAAVPYQSQVGRGEVRPIVRVDATTNEVFSQLGLMGADGKMNLKRVTLALDENGKSSWNRDEIMYPSDRVAPEVAQQIGNWI